VKSRSADARRVIPRSPTGPEISESRRSRSVGRSLDRAPAPVAKPQATRPSRHVSPSRQAAKHLSRHPSATSRQASPSRERASPSRKTKAQKARPSTTRQEKADTKKSSGQSARRRPR
jgi:hypothetical protein